MHRHAATKKQESDQRLGRVAARTTGIGIGLVVFMITWTVGARIAEHVWGPPSSAFVAMTAAVAAGVVVAVVSGRRLVRPRRREPASRVE